MALHYGVMARLVAATFFHLSPEGRGRVTSDLIGGNEGEGVRKLRLFS
jgi:hypothetical protein